MFVSSAQDIRDGIILYRVKEHLEEAKEHFHENEIVGCFLQGSQNYGLDYVGSDVDTKLIVVPSFKDICLNRKPVSTTHVRANDEHTDWKDVRLYMETFRKQNLNFLEILFTDYFVLNPAYAEQWMRLVEKREEIARMNVHRAVKSMKGIALEKYHAMEHRYPTKIDIIDKYGYDPKQLHHLLRVEEYLQRYIAGESYENCLVSPNREYLIDVKLGKYDLATARVIAEQSKKNVEAITQAFCNITPECENADCRELLEDVSYRIMKIAVEKELFQS